MAILRVQNNTQNILNIPVLNMLLQPYHVRDGEIVDIDEFYNDDRIQGLMKHPAKISVTLISDSTPGAEGDAVLPFYPASMLPDATQNPGMMLFNTTESYVMYSDGTSWLVITSVPVFRNSNMPNPSDLPDGYLVYNTDDQVLLLARAGTWYYTTAGGIRDAPSHLIPPAGTVPRGAMYFDSDNERLQVSDGTNWQLVNNVNDYATIANLPPVGDVGFGALAFTDREGTLWTRVGANWLPTTGVLRFYADFASLPTTGWGNDERGAVAYINDDRTIVIWDGKYWRYPTQLPDYKTSDLPTAADYSNGHMILNGDHIQPLVAWSGNWQGMTAAAKAYTAVTRPANTDVPEGTMIWNLTSGKANFNVGGSWLDALGVLDP